MTKNNVQYVAFLRGINVGGKKKVPMAELKLMFENMGFGDVRTFLATGNVIFSASENDVNLLEEKIGKRLYEEFGFTIKVLVRDMDGLKKLVASEPFKEINVTKETRLYVTFLSQNPSGSMSLPYTSPDGAFQILKMAYNALFSALTVASARTVDAMNVIEKEFGKEVTTRNWNTVLKICEK